MSNVQVDQHGLKVDAATGQTVNSHEWDGIQELNTPLPRWWINIFYATIIWSIGYMIAYPAWPLFSDYTKGMLGYSTRVDVANDVAAIKAERTKQAAGLANASLDAIKADPNMSRMAMAQGKAAFGDNCAPCHGSGAAGSKGYPNLNDDDWIWGGKLEDIHKTIVNGVRVAGNNDTRVNVMAAYGRDGVLKPDEIRAVANYVRKLANLPTEQGADLTRGAKVFADNCVACHGDAGKGNQELGAPNLTDGIWLYGSDLPVLIDTITNGRSGVMPAWAGRLDPVTIKALTVYVHSLGGGK